MSSYFAQAADDLEKAQFAANDHQAGLPGYLCMWTAARQAAAFGGREWAAGLIAKVTGVTLRVRADGFVEVAPILRWNDSHTKAEVVAALREAAELERKGHAILA